MIRSVALATAVILCGCAGGSAPQHVRFSKLGFDLPADWQAKDTSRRGLAISTWTPEDNDRKESITVIRTELAPAMAKADPETLERLLASAQTGLAHAKSDRVAPLTTTKGMTGAVVSVDYTPPGLSRPYHRIHAVLVDGGTLVHVLYTAADPRQVTFDGVLGSLHHEES